jgi:hypothetical protein
LYLLRFIRTVQQWAFLEDLLDLSPLYLAATGLLWGAAGLILGWGLWRGWRRAPALTLLAGLAYSLYFWLDRLLVGSGGPGTNWPFAAAVNLVLLGLAAWIVSRQRARAFFQTIS